MDVFPNFKIKITLTYLTN